MPEQNPLIPIPGVTGNDVTGNQVSPADLLRQIYMRQQPVQPIGSITAQSTPTPRVAPTLMPMAQGPTSAQGEFATKGGHQRASMAGLSNSLQNTVAAAHNALQEHEQKLITQKTDAYTHAIAGMNQADEILKNDPTNTEALQMKASNQKFLQMFLDPSTPEGKKNIKLLTKAYPETQPEEVTPEMRAAQGSAKKLKSQMDYQAMAKTFQSGQGQPVTMGMSPQTQIYAQMVKQGVAPKAATGGQVLQSQTAAAKALETGQEKQQQTQAKEQMQRERLGLRPDGTPMPENELPPTTRAKIMSERASDGLKEAEANLAQAKQKALENPNSVANQLALGRLGAMKEFASARMLQAQTSLLTYKMNALGVGGDNQPLPGAQMVGGSSIGTRLGPQMDKIMSQQSQFLDIYKGLDEMNAAVDAMEKGGYAINDPRLVKLLTDTHVTQNGNMDAFNNWVNSEATKSLPREQRDYLVAVKQLKERGQGARKMVGQGVSNAQVNNLLATFPGATTPDYDYARKQLRSAAGMMNNLQQGVPHLNIPGGTMGNTGQQPQPTPDKLTNDLNEALKF